MDEFIFRFYNFLLYVRVFLYKKIIGKIQFSKGDNVRGAKFDIYSGFIGKVGEQDGLSTRPSDAIVAKGLHVVFVLWNEENEPQWVEEFEIRKITKNKR